MKIEKPIVLLKRNHYIKCFCFIQNVANKNTNKTYEQGGSNNDLSCSDSDLSQSNIELSLSIHSQDRSLVGVDMWRLIILFYLFIQNISLTLIS
jgi:hypothetical protein